MSYKKSLIVGISLFGLVVLTAFSTFYASLGKFHQNNLVNLIDSSFVSFVA